VRRWRLNVKERIVNWLRELKEKGVPTEVVGFYQELPIRVKSKVLDFDDEFVQWESEPKLCLAAAEGGKLFFNFFDPSYQENRLLGADVTYYGSSFVETTFPLPSSDPRFRRQSVRVITSNSLPVKLFLVGEEGEKRELTVRDVSEGGVGAIGEDGLLKVGQPVKVELVLPDGALCLRGEVASVEPYEDKEKFGIRLFVKEKERKLLRNYVMARQREILSKIREIVG